MRWPDFFIVGAPKCGTTALCQYLRQHPEIFLPHRKEPHFFAPDLYSGTTRDERYFTRDERAYLELFRDAQAHQRVGEASVYYLYSEVAARAIKHACPQARIVVMLRNPVDLVHALHGQRVKSGAEHITDFEAALAAEPARREGRELSPHAFNVKGLLYRDVARFSAQVMRYLECFDPASIHFVLYDDFRADTGTSYGAVCEFLGVSSAYRPSFEVVNAAAVVRSAGIRHLLVQPPLPVRVARRLGFRSGLGRLLKRLNRKPEQRAPLPPAVRNTLWQEFAPDVERLSGIVGRDLVALWAPST